MLNFLLGQQSFFHDEIFWQNDWKAEQKETTKARKSEVKMRAVFSAFLLRIEKQ
jgi:hypothetical protein